MASRQHGPSRTDGFAVTASPETSRGQNLAVPSLSPSWRLV